jgi:hypothetical protein
MHAMGVSTTKYNAAIVVNAKSQRTGKVSTPNMTYGACNTLGRHSARHATATALPVQAQRTNVSPPLTATCQLHAARPMHKSVSANPKLRSVARAGRKSRLTNLALNGSMLLVELDRRSMLVRVCRLFVLQHKHILQHEHIHAGRH